MQFSYPESVHRSGFQTVNIKSIRGNIVKDNTNEANGQSRVARSIFAQGRYPLQYKRPARFPRETSESFHHRSLRLCRPIEWQEYRNIYKPSRLHVMRAQSAQGLDTSKNLARDFEIIEISLISCDFNDFVKHLKLAISKENLVQIILIHLSQRVIKL